MLHHTIFDIKIVKNTVQYKTIFQNMPNKLKILVPNIVVHTFNLIKLI